MASAEILFALAGQFVGQGDYTQAVRALQPLCSSQHQLPVTAARARVALAHLLLGHFQNSKEAMAQLKRVELELNQTSGNWVLKCEVCELIALCHRNRGATEQQRQALLRGLQLCQQGAASLDRQLLQRWEVYLHFRLAEQSMLEVGPPRGLQDLEGLEGPAGRLTSKEHILHLLFRSHLHLCDGDADAAKSDLSECLPLVEAAAAQGGALNTQLRSHYLLMHVATIMAGGRLGDLQQGKREALRQMYSSSNAVLLQELLELLRGLEGQEWLYSWLPTPAVHAAAHLLQAALLRGIGKLPTAAVHLAAAEEAVVQQLQQFQYNLEDTESSLQPRGIWEGRSYAHLRLLLLEQQIITSLVCADFQRAAQQLGVLTGMLERFPTILRDFVPTTHMLLGQYAYSMQEYAAGAAHFQHVLDSDATNLQTLAAAAAALAELHADQGPAGVDRALALLQQHGLADLALVSALPAHEKSATLLTSALINQRQADEAGTRLHLTKALKCAHTTLGNTQMVTQVLNTLAPIQLAKDDAAGAQQMFMSAITLARAQGDLPSLVAALRGVCDMYTCHPVLAATEEGMRLAQKQREYLARKAPELEAHLQAAAGAVEHAALLDWMPKA